MTRIALLALLASGCAHRREAERHVQMEPMVFQKKPSGEIELVDAASLFERASVAFRDKRFAESAELFDRLVVEYPDSRYVVPSLYNAGLALEGLGLRPAACERYQKLIARHPLGGGGTDALDARFRLAQVYGELQNWPAAAEAYAQILSGKDLSLSDRVEAMTRRGVAQYEMKDLGLAERTLREALAYARKHEGDERLDTDFFLGMGAYYLGEIAHAQYRGLPVRLPEKQLQDDLEAKARMLLVAQNRYYDAIRVKNPDWATAAGYQIANLYQEFYDDLAGAPVPPQLSAEAREVYQEEVKKKVASLLTKAVKIHEMNVLMGERAGVSGNDWVRRSNEQMDRLRKLLTPGAPTPPAQVPALPPVTPPPLPGRREDGRSHPMP